MKFKFIIGAISVVVMFAMTYAYKYSVRDESAEIAILIEKINEEKEDIARLKAEWSMLTRADRIQELETNYLHFVPPSHQNYLPIEWLPDREETTPSQDWIAQQEQDNAISTGAITKPVQSSPKTQQRGGE